MNFKGNGIPLRDKGLDRVCATLCVHDAEIWAVLTVETRGFGFFEDRRPQILFERHIFHRLTSGKFDEGNADISSELPGGYLSGSDEYTRLEKAMALDIDAALKSCSWGIGQVMGFNYAISGFGSVSEMVLQMVADENAQLMAMAKFIENNNLAAALQRKNWGAFARGYNGREYKKNEYDTRLAAAYAKYSVNLPDITLRAAQAALIFLGIDPGPVDGFRGRRTLAAILAFQERYGLHLSGELDGDTEELLFIKAFN